MSLLTNRQPYGPWQPPVPACDQDAHTPMIKALAEMVRRGGDLHKLGVAANTAFEHFWSRLAEGRWEAAEVRTVLRLPMHASAQEVIRAIEDLRRERDDLDAARLAKVGG